MTQHADNDKPVVIDPSTCRCTECIIGLHTPYFELTGAQIARMINGDPVVNNTGSDINFRMDVTDHFATFWTSPSMQWTLDRSDLEGDLTLNFPAN